MKRFIVSHRYIPIFIITALLHMSVLGLVRFSTPSEQTIDEREYEIIKLVDVEEFIPPPETPKTTVVYNQPSISEKVIATDDEVIEITTPQSEIEYVPQHKISIVPDIPTGSVLENIVYPPMALRQGIEGIVYLELFIDTAGMVRKIQVLKDPGHGFAEAAVAALTGLRCKPAYANGKPVAVRFRYPVRFKIQQ